jgi:hypothetical protein
MANGVVFRRIHGHVVPIRMNQEQKKGAGLVASGATVGVAAGVASANLKRDAAHYENAGKNYKAAYKFAKTTGNNRAAGQFKYLTKQNRLERMRFIEAGRNVQRIGLLGGSAMIAAGVHKLLPKKFKKENKKTTAAVDAGAGLGSAVLIRAAHQRTIQPKLTKIVGGAVKRKNATWEAFKLATKRMLVRGIKL